MAALIPLPNADIETGRKLMRKIQDNQFSLTAEKCSNLVRNVFRFKN